MQSRPDLVSFYSFLKASFQLPLGTGLSQQTDDRLNPRMISRRSSWCFECKRVSLDRTQKGITLYYSMPGRTWLAHLNFACSRSGEAE